jgi:hypothetical protein
LEAKLSTPVIAFESVESPPSKREERLRRQRADALNALHDAMIDAGLITSWLHDQTVLGRCVYSAWKAESDFHSYLERRLRQFERTVRVILASDVVPDDQRERIRQVLFGKRNVGRDPKTLSEPERVMFDNYRSMDAAGRQMVRTLLERLAVTSTATDKREGHDRP